MIRLYRLLLTLAVPDLARRHGDEMASTAALLAADARAAGVGAWLGYWAAELRSLASTVRRERQPRKASRVLPNLIHGRFRHSHIHGMPMRGSSS